MEAALQSTIQKDAVIAQSGKIDRRIERMSLEEVFLAHKDQVFRAAYRITGSASDAEDVLQSVFLKLARREPGALDDEIQHLSSYLHRAAVNAALDMIRARRDAQNMPLEDAEITRPLELSSRDEGEYSVHDLRCWLRQAVAKLGRRSAEMFVMRYLEGHDNREIAKALKTTRATVAVTLHRTRSLLKQDFRAYMEGKQ